MKSIAFIGLALAAALAAAGAPICSVSGSGLAFGAYDAIGSRPLDTVGTVTVTCSGTPGDTVQYTIALLANGPGASARRISSASKLDLLYFVYIDSARTQAWGDGAAGTAPLAGALQIGADGTAHNTHTIYARLPARQNGAPAGRYTESSTILLTY